MGTLGRVSIFLVAMAVGVVAALYMNHAPVVARLHTSHGNLTDLVIWTFGVMFAGSALYKLVMPADSIDFRWGILLVVGAVMIYGEVANVPWLKEQSCRLINGRHHPVWTTPCYRPG